MVPIHLHLMLPETLVLIQPRKTPARYKPDR
jgi:hypothetical protein